MIVLNIEKLKSILGLITSEDPYCGVEGEDNALSQLIIYLEENNIMVHQSPVTYNVNEIEAGTPIVAKYGHNDVLNKPFEFLYEFGYYTDYGCVVYNRGECNMQDSHAFKLEQIRIATPEDLKKHYWGH